MHCKTDTSDHSLAVAEKAILDNFLGDAGPQALLPAAATVRHLLQNIARENIEQRMIAGFDAIDEVILQQVPVEKTQVGGQHHIAEIDELAGLVDFQVNQQPSIVRKAHLRRFDGVTSTHRA
jgi:hypothetical protein